MFSLTLLDHLNLTFSQVAERHKAHTNAAESYRKWNRRLRGAEALLIGGVSIAASAAAFGRGGQAVAIVAATLASLALIVLLINLTFDFESSAHAHLACSTQLWSIRERYGSLLSDLREGAVDLAEARFRRDQLMDELRAMYEKTSVTPLGEVDLPQQPQTTTANAA
jgi:conflict system pore-forming effector with SLATT domain